MAKPKPPMIPSVANHANRIQAAAVITMVRPQLHVPGTSGNRKTLGMLKSSNHRTTNAKGCVQRGRPCAAKQADPRDERHNRAEISECLTSRKPFGTGSHITVKRL
jgi:hypothetical protein